MKVRRCKAFLCMLAISQWGQRMEVTDWKAYDVMRGAQLFNEVRPACHCPSSIPSL